MFHHVSRCVRFFEQGRCVSAFARESERGSFVREVEKRNEKRLGDKIYGGSFAGFFSLLIVGVHREPGNVCI